jgi:glycosyltransferase involved in cell wall biosynthesis
MPAKKIVIVGPSITGTKGGMATVINDMLSLNQKTNYRFEHLVSHAEVSAPQKIFLTAKTFFKILTYGDYDLLHIHVASGASFYRKSLAVRAGRIRKKPIVMHVHGADFDSFYHRSSALSKKLIRRTFAACDKVLVLSSYWKEFFDKHIYDGNTEIIHNGVYLPVFASCRTVPDNIRSFLFLGRLGQRKGVYDLLEAIDQLVNREGNRDLRFFLAGDGDLEQVKEIIQAKKLVANVEVLGWIDEQQKLSLFKQVDTMLLPSYNEGLPMAILEAMAAGKVIISSRVGGIPDAVKGGINGFLIEPGEVDRLAQHILHVSRHPDEMIDIAEQNIRRIDADYNLEKINERLLQIYTEISQ